MHVVKPPGIGFETSDNGIVSRCVASVPCELAQESCLIVLIAFGRGRISKTEPSARAGSAAEFPLRFGWETHLFISLNEFLYLQHCRQLKAELLGILERNGFHRIARAFPATWIFSHDGFVQFLSDLVLAYSEFSGHFEFPGRQGERPAAGPAKLKRRGKRFISRRDQQAFIDEEFQ